MLSVPSVAACRRTSSSTPRPPTTCWRRGSLRYRFVEVDDTTLAPIKPSGAPIHEGEVGWPLADTIEWLESRGVEVVELDAADATDA